MYWNYLIGTILIIIWIIAGVYLTEASIDLGNFSNLDDNFYTAHRYAYIATFLTWFLVVLFFVLLILAAVGVISLFSTGEGEALEAESNLSAEAKLLKSNIKEESTGVSWVTILFILFALFLVAFSGVLAILVAINIKESPNYDSTNVTMNNAYNDAVIAAALGIGAASVLIIGFIIYLVVGFTSGTKKTDSK